MGNDDQVESGDAGEIGTQAGVLACFKAQQSPDTRFAQIRIENNGLVPELRQRDGKVGSCSGFPFTRECARHENDLWWMTGLREQERGSQRTESFRHLRFGKVMRDQFHSLLGPIARSALE